MGFLKDVICAWTNKENIERDIESLKRENAVLRKDIESLKNKGQHQETGASKEPTQSCPTESDKPKNVVNEKSAKQVFSENLEKFLPFLAELTNESFDGEKWKELIGSFGNSEMNTIWAKTKGKPDSLLRILAFWGYKPELCSSFVCTGNENDMYEEGDGGSLTNGIKYDVLSKCWLHTDNNGTKNVVLKGKVKKV